MITHLEVVVETSSFTMDKAKKMKVEAKDAAAASLAMWDKMKPDFQDAIIRTIQGGLETMHEKASDWIPSCAVKGVGGDRIEIKLSLNMADVQSQVAAASRISEFEIENTKRKIKDYLLGDISLLDDKQFMEYVLEATKSGTKITIEDTTRLLGMVDHG